MDAERRLIGYRLLFAVDAIIEGRGKPKKLRKEFFAALGPFVGAYFRGRSDSTIRGDGHVTLTYQPQPPTE